jgi:hypothetical protein
MAENTPMSLEAPFRPNAASDPAPTAARDVVMAACGRLTTQKKR